MLLRYTIRVLVYPQDYTIIFTLEFWNIFFLYHQNKPEPITSNSSFFLPCPHPQALATSNLHSESVYVPAVSILHN